MTEFRHLKNLCEFIANSDQFTEAFVDDTISVADAKHVFAEHIYNLLLEDDVEEKFACDLADTLADNYFKINKELKSIQHYFEASQLHTVVIFEDDSVIHIFVQRGMIFVADCDYEELSQRIENDDTESFEAYDTIDGCDYYKRSAYAEYINCALLQISNRYL